MESSWSSISPGMGGSLIQTPPYNLSEVPHWPHLYIELSRIIILQEEGKWLSYMLTYPIRFVLVNRHGRWREQWRGSLRGRSVSLLCRWWVFVDKVGWWQKGEETNSTNCFLVSTRSVGETVMLSLTWWGGELSKITEEEQTPPPRKKIGTYHGGLRNFGPEYLPPTPLPPPKIRTSHRGLCVGDGVWRLPLYPPTIPSRSYFATLHCTTWKRNIWWLTVTIQFLVMLQWRVTLVLLPKVIVPLMSWHQTANLDAFLWWEMILNYKSVFHWIVTLYILMKASDFVIISVSILKFHFAYVNSSYEGLFRWCTWSCMFGISRHTGSVNFAVGVLETAIQKFSNFRPWVSTFQTCYKACFDD